MLLFPTLQPEELLYSACARYGELMCYPGSRWVARDLFGTPQATAVLDLPLGLNTLVSRLPRGTYDVEDLVRLHTTLPYYSHFVGPAKLAEITTRMRTGGRGPVPHTLLGVGRGRVSPPLHLLYCASCAREDLETAGEPCWRRAHQLPGVYVCPDHGETLLPGPVRRKDLVRVFDYDSLRATLEWPHRPNPLPDSVPERLNWLADASLRLLQMPPRMLTAEELRGRHRAELRRLGLLSPRGTLRTHEAEQLLVAHWGDSLLASLGLHPASAERRISSWVRARAGSAPRVSAGHPLQHLLLIGMYGITPEEFLEGNRCTSTVKAVGLASECANPACPNYLPRIRRSAARRLYHRTGAAWHCRTCGARYEEFSGHCGVRFIETGDLWDAELCRLVELGTSVRELQAWCSMGYELVLCHCARLGVWRDAWGNPDDYRLAVRQALAVTMRDRRREEWLRLRANFPDPGVHALRAQARALWSWLRRNDNAWLLANSPAHAKRPPTLVSWIDWSQRDRELHPRVEDAIEALLEKHPPVRLTVASIGRQAGVRTLVVRERGRLPLTAATVKAAVESVAAFTRRRIKVTAEDHIRAGTIPNYSDFLEGCGIEWKNRAAYEGELQQALQRIDNALAPGPQHV
jgi:hypothetical protein